MNIARSSPQGRAGFTLLEMLGVMAIISIIASMTVPSIVARINRASSTKESKALAAIAEALEDKILGDKSIPGEATWAQLIADELDVPLSQVTTSVGQQPRIYLWDPAISVGGQSGILPYAQTGDGSSVQPQNMRIMIISSQFLPLPASLISGVAPTQQEFDDLWNTPRGSVPANWPSDWTTRGEDLHVQRLNLTPLFHHLVINDITEGGSAAISVDGGTAITIPGGGLGGYYFEGTEIALLNESTVNSIETLSADLSYTYERGIWRGQLWEGKLKDATDFATALDRFRLARSLQQASADQQLVIDAYYNYALVYASWARAGFPTYDPQNQVIPLYESLLNTQSQLQLLTANLILQ
ncbi:MAG: prepilin-type N-terminal cleavage/methylation domain-containing protein [Verrucomicrobiales bacterium]|jgi:prepilin-type N-terminal cleavage/methylation domain-containing protein